MSGGLLAKRGALFLITAGAICFVAWAGGVDFSERGPPMGAIAYLCIALGGLAAAFPDKQS